MPFRCCATNTRSAQCCSMRKALLLGFVAQDYAKACLERASDIKCMPLHSSSLSSISIGASSSSSGVSSLDLFIPWLIGVAASVGLAALASAISVGGLRPGGGPRDPCAVPEAARGPPGGPAKIDCCAVVIVAFSVPDCGSARGCLYVPSSFASVSDLPFAYAMFYGCIR